MGTTPGIPVLETGRLRLRPFTPADADAVRAFAGAQEVGETTLNLPHPYPPGAAAAWIKTHGQLAMAGEAHREGAPFYNSCRWAKPPGSDENVRGGQCRGRHTVVPRAGAGQPFAQGVAPHRPLSRPIVGSTQERLSEKQSTRHLASR